MSARRRRNHAGLSEKNGAAREADVFGLLRVSFVDETKGGSVGVRRTVLNLGRGIWRGSQRTHARDAHGGNRVLCKPKVEILAEDAVGDSLPPRHSLDQLG